MAKLQLIFPTFLLAIVFNGVIAQKIYRFKIVSSFNESLVSDVIVTEKKSYQTISYTIDSSGFINVIAPENTKKHLRIFSPMSGYAEVNLRKVTEPLHTIHLAPNCEIQPASANEDTSSGSLKILRYGPYPLTRNDSSFCRQYNVKLITYGCVVPCDNCLIYYNKTIFSYLDKKYGISWRQNIVSKPPGLE
jgi:hypothetical protein